MKILLTGAAGFLGSHLAERLIADGHTVTGMDSYLTGNPQNIAAFEGDARFNFKRQDVSEPFEFEEELDWILHFASPASPPDYLALPIETLRVGSLATLNLLDLAVARSAGFFLASTSEVYGDPLVHPQPESYWGNVNPIGPRSVYDEAKRFSEAATYAYHRTKALDVRVARIFNTYGPRLQRNDGRAVANFISQSLAGEPVTVHGDGKQTRSLCYVSDTVEALVKLLESGETGPVNVGNDAEVTVLDLANLVRDLVGTESEVQFVSRPVDDPQTRRPDLSVAMRALGYQPQVDLSQGLATTVDWCRANWPP